jgi:hypothetical protein
VFQHTRCHLRVHFTTWPRCVSSRLSMWYTNSEKRLGKWAEFIEIYTCALIFFSLYRCSYFHILRRGRDFKAYTRTTREHLTIIAQKQQLYNS